MGDPTGTQDVLRRRPGVLHRTCGDEVLVLPPDADAPLVLAGVAALVWRALEEPGSLDDVLVAASHAAPLPPDAAALLAAARDLLLAAGAVEPGAAGPAPGP